MCHFVLLTCGTFFFLFLTELMDSPQITQNEEAFSLSFPDILKVVNKAGTALFLPKHNNLPVTVCVLMQRFKIKTF